MAYSGKWKLESNENLEEFLKATNVGEAMRPAALKSSLSLDITQNGDEFTIVTTNAVKTTELKFKIGEKFVFKSPMFGEDANMLTTWEGNKQVAVNVDNPDGVKITREVQGDKMVVKQTKGDVTATRIFVRC